MYFLLLAALFACGISSLVAVPIEVTGFQPLTEWSLPDPLVHPEQDEIGAAGELKQKEKRQDSSPFYWSPLRSLGVDEAEEAQLAQELQDSYDNDAQMVAEELSEEQLDDEEQDEIEGEIKAAIDDHLLVGGSIVKRDSEGNRQKRSLLYKVVVLDEEERENFEKKVPKGKKVKPAVEHIVLTDLTDKWIPKKVGPWVFFKPATKN